MDEPNSPSDIAIDELSRMVKNFEAELREGMRDPEHFLTISEIEGLWGDLVGKTHILYSNMVQDIIDTVDEKELLRKKKRST